MRRASGMTIARCVGLSEREAQVVYYALCARAVRAGVSVSVDDPDSPRTVGELRRAVEAAEGWSA